MLRLCVSAGRTFSVMKHIFYCHTSRRRVSRLVLAPGLAGYERQVFTPAHRFCQAVQQQTLPVYFLPPLRFT